MKSWNVLSWLKEAVIWHYSNTQYDRNETQLEREKWLIPKIIPFNRHMLMPCAALSQVRFASATNTPAKLRHYCVNAKNLRKLEIGACTF